MKISNFSNLEKGIIGIGALVIMFLPALLSLHLIPSPFDEGSSWLGSAIGGITAPVVGVLSALLLYITIKLQIQSSKDNDEKQRLADETRMLHFYYSSLKSSIDNYSFEPSNGKRQIGSQAIYAFLNDFYCNPHKYENEVENNAHVTELKSILEIFNIVLNNVASSTAVDKNAILELTKHQFNYRVFPRLNFPEITEGNFCKAFCESCECDHGLPEDFTKLLVEIRSKLSYP